jgi:uncharacterized protein (TIGR02246 family)
MSARFEQAAREIAAEWEAAWNTHDMARIAKLLTDDVDWVTVTGGHLKGRLEVERVHAALHETQFQASVWSNQELEIHAVKADVSLVHLRWSVRGDFDPDGSPRQPRSGVFSWLLVEQQGTWRIRAAQGTNAVAQPVSANGAGPDAPASTR